MCVIGRGGKLVKFNYDPFHDIVAIFQIYLLKMRLEEASFLIERRRL